MALTPAQQVVVKQIYESELDYREIKERIAVLLAIPSRTPDENRILADYQAKIARDEALILAWYNALRAAGATRNEIVGPQAQTTYRQSSLDAFVAQETAEKVRLIALFDAAWAEWQANNPTALDEDKLAQKAALDADKAARLAIKDLRLSYLASLKAGGLSWLL